LNASIDFHTIQRRIPQQQASAMWGAEIVGGDRIEPYPGPGGVLDQRREALQGDIA
jgi:hypothetical protein